MHRRKLVIPKGGFCKRNLAQDIYYVLAMLGLINLLHNITFAKPIMSANVLEVPLIYSNALLKYNICKIHEQSKLKE